MKTKKSSSFLIIFCLLFAALQPVSFASDDFIAPEEFLQRAFEGDTPGSNTVWITGDTKAAAREILGHDPDFLRMRYWGDEARSAWIIDEIGKTEPITIGIVVSGDSIESIEVLAFRESRGWEIKYDFFKRQFFGAGLAPDHKLNRDIDGISGATLSVRAMTNVSRLVLFLAESVST